ncbi:transporter [Thiopseudomonas alkaliphila]|nr:YbfB/YjiJ family MFS transporter [Thiopseudomonas alkaliphila]AKX45135.1 transporter [Thiopseudomonas alkaliphila]AKX48454.1 transporter [Thiopseudomonas alkaliphila]AKX55453.1 transporter [Thiopseudomonas alkaliphila]
MPKPSMFRVIFACATLLLVVHTLGRFIYTPLMPWLIKDNLFSLQQGSIIVTWNYLGYLLGAIAAIYWSSLSHIQRILPWAITISVLSTLLQTQADNTTKLTVLRLINGITNGLVFVQAPSLVLEWLSHHKRPHLSGLVYLGVSIGLILSSLLVFLTSSFLNGAERWWPAAIIAIPLASWGYIQLSRIDIQSIKKGDTNKLIKPSQTPLIDYASAPLFLSYAGAGLGYILPMTYLPTLASTGLSEHSLLTNGSWLILALATLPSPWIWNKAGNYLGDVQALRLNYLVQFLGVIAVLYLPLPIGLTVCALLVGNTFLGTVLLTQRLARTLHPHQAPRLSAALVALYSLTQLVGPWITSLWLKNNGSLLLAFNLSAASLFWGLITSLLITQKTSS